MSIVTKGFGTGNLIITQGYGLAAIILDSFCGVKRAVLSRIAKVTSRIRIERVVDE